MSTCRYCGGPWFEPRFGALFCCDCDRQAKPQGGQMTAENITYNPMAGEVSQAADNEEKKHHDD
jgi:uncharacterized Zn finger protein (UPF0148 family)